MYDEHWSDKNNICIIVDIHSCAAIIAVIVFSSFSSLSRWAGGATLRQWNVDLGRNWLILIICELHLEVQLDKLFRILWATFHRLSRHHTLGTICRTIGIILYWAGCRMENTCSLLCEAAQALER